jgi:hypothetical protein
MDKILIFLGILVLSLGGLSAIVIPFSSFLGKIWAERFMKKKIAEYDRQIEYYNSSLDMERERYKALNEQILYKSQKAFDIEFKIFQDIVPMVMDTSYSIINYLMMKNIMEEDKEFNKVLKDLNNTQDEFIKNSAFIDIKIDKIISRYISNSDNRIRCVNEYRTQIKNQNNFLENDLYIKIMNEDYNYANMVMESLYEVISIGREISKAIKDIIQENGKMK